MARVTGIGGVFFKASSELGTWYEKNLGIKLESFGGAVLRWPQDTAEDKGVTVWSTAKRESDWFPGPLMINYRIDNMAEMLEQLRTNGVEIAKGPEFHENGAFAWVVDPDGNKVELWEPKLWNEANKK
jgi:predicted enzyme related to lactoylglutathione lyase